MPKRAAVVIGVNKTGNLIKLESAVACAKAVAKWLQDDEQYDVELLTDETGPVTTALIKEAIRKFVKTPPRYHQLVVYFSGHGYWKTRQDYWLLSNAADDTDEAINLDGAMDLARYSGIPNVIFISDACRSIPDSRSGQFLEGIDAFPTFPNISSISKIDYFKATSDALQAYEIHINGKPESVLTYAILSAYREANDEMIKTITDGGNVLEVVPNRRLEHYLQTKVDDTLAKVNPSLIQQLDVNVPSSDNTFIGKVLGKAHQSSTTDKVLIEGLEKEARRVRKSITHIPAGGRSTHVTHPVFDDEPRFTSLSRNDVKISNDVSRTLERSFTTRGFSRGNVSLDVEKNETEDQISLRLPSDKVVQFESQCGFSVSGAKIKQVICTGGPKQATAEILDYGTDTDSNQPAVIRVWDAQPGCSLLIRLEDDRGLIVPAFVGYIGHLVVKPVGLTNISYIPSQNSPRWAGYERKKDKIDRLRALVSIAIENHVFKLRSDKEANSLAGRIRIEKSIDPVLGLYAAHAYYQAGEDERIESIKEYMYDDLQAVLFDIHVLTSRFEDDSEPLILPLCPMLTQTWNLLRAREIDLPPYLSRASAYLSNSLWTTFEPAGTEIVFKEMQNQP